MNFTSPRLESLESLQSSALPKAGAFLASLETACLGWMDGWWGKLWENLGKSHEISDTEIFSGNQTWLENGPLIPLIFPANFHS